MSPSGRSMTETPAEMDEIERTHDLTNPHGAPTPTTTEPLKELGASPYWAELVEFSETSLEREFTYTFGGRTFKV